MYMLIFTSSGIYSSCLESRIFPRAAVEKRQHKLLLSESQLVFHRLKLASSPSFHMAAERAKIWSCVFERRILHVKTSSRSFWTAALHRGHEEVTAEEQSEEEACDLDGDLRGRQMLEWKGPWKVCWGSGRFFQVTWMHYFRWVVWLSEISNIISVPESLRYRWQQPALPEGNLLSNISKALWVLACRGSESKIWMYSTCIANQYLVSW